MSEIETGKRPKTKAKSRKQSAETIAKRIASIKARREGRSPPDIIGAIAALRTAKRAIIAGVCKGAIKDLSEVELSVFIALRHLQGG